MFVEITQNTYYLLADRSKSEFNIVEKEHFYSYMMKTYSGENLKKVYNYLINVEQYYLQDINA